VKIVVLVKEVPDTWGSRRLNLETGILDRAASESVVDEITEYALEVALRYQDSNNAEVIALAMGPSSATSALRKSLSMGADSAVLIQDDALRGSDLIRTSAAIAAAAAKLGADLVIAGNISTDGRGGVIPAMVAERLGFPHLTYLNSVTIAAQSVAGVREAEYGTVTAHAALPAVISVTERASEPRFPNFKSIMRAKKKPLTVMSLSDLGLDPAATLAGAGRSVVLDTTERPPRSAGVKIVDEGNAGVELAEFLAAGRLI